MTRGSARVEGAPVPARPRDEWLEADGLGGSASGTADGIATRRYHALLLVATTPPTGRAVLVNGVEVSVETEAGRFALSSPVLGGAAAPIESFDHEPWPRWRYRLPDGTPVEHEVFVPKDAPAVALSWRVAGAGVRATLRVRPLLSCRDHHALARESAAFRFDARRDGRCVAWRPRGDLPEVIALTNGAYRHAPEWRRGVAYEEERARGLDWVEDLGSPGEFVWERVDGEAVLLLAARLGSVEGALGARRLADGATSEPDAEPAAILRRMRDEDPAALVADLRASERARRAAFPSPLHRAADAYLVRRGRRKTIVAGYPWFTDWGRDTFIALRGLCLAGGRADDARAILLEWAGAISEGMAPNRFPDEGGAPEYNAVDASLWYVIAVHDLVAASGAPGGRPLDADDEARLRAAVTAIFRGYAGGARFDIRAGDDGLLAAGVPGSQLTWMDAKCEGQVFTPRIGKPVEVQALWLNALRFARAFAPEALGVRGERLLARGLAAFGERFWCEATGGLHDVVDVDHRPGTADPAIRPNQILAAGGLPWPVIDRERARRVVDLVEARLWTPLGLRSLAPGEPGYAPRYEGDRLARDAAYHQGTVWPWLLGPFVEAWVRVRGDTIEARREARARFLAPLLAHLGEAGLGHISEIADGDPPHTPRGCPFQAWSVGEALRLEEQVLDEGRPVAPPEFGAE